MSLDGNNCFTASSDHTLQLSQEVMNTQSAATWEKGSFVKMVVRVIELGKGPKTYSV